MARALVLTGSLGAGHDASAARFATELTRLGWPARVIDAMTLLGARSGRAGERVFRALIARGALYDALHYAQLRTGGRLSDAMDSLAANRIGPALQRQTGPDDRLLLSTFPTGAAAAARLAAGRPGLSTVVFCPDAVAHRLWVHPGTDLYLVTCPASVAWVHRFAPDARVEVIPFPLAEQFYRPPTRAAARARLSVPGAARCVLLLGGGWGIGPIHALAGRLAAGGVRVLAVAGRNQRLAGQLARLARGQPLLSAFAFSDQIATLMAAADLVVTAPGAGSCAEVRAVGRPMVLLDVLPGHGREAIDYQLARGGAVVAGSRPDRAARVINAALRSPPALAPDGGPGDWRAPFATALAGLGIGVARG